MQGQNQPAPWRRLVLTLRVRISVNASFERSDALHYKKATSSLARYRYIASLRCNGFLKYRLYLARTLILVEDKLISGH